MQWMADGIHDFTVTDHQKNPLEELIVSWKACALSEISKKIIAWTFLKCVQNMIFNTSFAKRHLCFLLPFFSKYSLKKGLRIIHRHALYMGKHYTWVNMVAGPAESWSSLKICPFLISGCSWPVISTAPFFGLESAFFPACLLGFDKHYFLSGVWAWSWACTQLVKSSAGSIQQVSRWPALVILLVILIIIFTEINL